jgi:hypothetical protein
MASDFDQQLHDAIETLLEHGDLDKGAPAYGVALKAIHLGYPSLTRMEKALYDRVIVPALERRSVTGAPASPRRDERVGV